MMQRRPTSRTSSVKGSRPRRTRADRQLAQQMLSVLKAGGDARVGKIKRVRQKVRSKSYENELKLSVTVERVLSQVLS